ncbi:MAG: hypothetical protein M0Z33_05415 [Actinomycetota bacterium]|nr:hypothetical protein [Actinomycetota bacterium]
MSGAPARDARATNATAAPGGGRRRSPAHPAGRVPCDDYTPFFVSKRTTKRKLSTKKKANHGKKPNCGRG